MNNEFDILERYFKLIAKPEEELQEILKSDATIALDFKEFEEYIEKCEELENNGSILPDSASPILSEYNRKIQSLIEKENKTQREEFLVNKHFKEQEQTEDIQMTRTRTQQNNYPTKNNSAGYIDAAVILVMLLNVGFIIAMTILGNR